MAKETPDKSNPASDLTAKAIEVTSDRLLPSTPPLQEATIEDDSGPEAGAPAVRPPLTHIGHYELRGEIARGGMGVVYKAVDSKLNRVVALKVTQAAQLAGGDQAKRFRAEAEAAAKLDHPHIVPIYEVGEVDGLQFISMAFVEGQSLAQAVANGPLPARNAAALMRQVAVAVAYAHSHGVIHRDLKPGNIMVDAAGQPRVTDFGLAKRTDADSSLTQAGQVMGTPSYMSPEQAEGRNEQVGPLSDVYSLGATLYCLITGRPPFQSASVVETLKQVVEREPVAPRSLNHSVDRDLNTIVLKCLQKKPDKRYASASALAEDLQRHLDRRPILARPVGDIERVMRWGRRNPLVAGSLAGIMGIFLAAFALVSGSYFRAEDARQLAEQREKDERWERYRANMIAAGGAMQLHNISSARDALDAAPPEHRNWEWNYFNHQLDTAQYVVRVGEKCRTIAVSPDGAFAVVKPASGPARLWNLVTRQEGISLGDSAPVSFFYFSADSKTLAYESNGVVVAWDLAAGRERGQFRLPDSKLLDWRLSPDGTRLAACFVDKTVRVWNTATGNQLCVFRGHTQYAVRAVFSADGRQVVSAGGHDRTAQLWESETGKLIAMLNDHDEHVGQALINTQGDRVLTVESYPSNCLRLWEAPSGKLLKVMRGHTNGAEHVAFSQDGSRIASGGIDRTVRIWDGKTGEALASREGHRDRISSIGFSPDSKILISSAQDHTARLWDATTAAPFAVMHGHTGILTAAQYAPDGRTIVTASFADGTVRLWDARLAERSGFLRGHKSFVYSAVFHPDGERVVSAAWDGTVRIWNATTGSAISGLTYPSDPAAIESIVQCALVHPEGKLLVSFGRDHVVRLWDLTTKKDVHQFTREGVGTRLAMSAQGDLIAACCNDNAIHVWDIFRRVEVAVLRGQRNWSEDVAFGADGSWIASAGQDGTICVWNLKTQERIQVLETHNDTVYGLAVSHDGKWLASCSADGTARVWDTTTWKEAAALKHGTNVYCVSFSPDGTRLACACANNLIRLWDLSTFQLVAELDGHSDYVYHVAWSPDGTRLVSGSGDGTVRIWDSLSVTERAKRMR